MASPLSHFGLRPHSYRVPNDARVPRPTKVRWSKAQMPEGLDAEGFDTGRTIRNVVARRGRSMVLLKRARIVRSASLNLGRSIWRCSTRIWCRSARISVSWEAPVSKTQPIRVGTRRASGGNRSTSRSTTPISIETRNPLIRRADDLSQARTGVAWNSRLPSQIPIPTGRVPAHHFAHHWV